MAVYLFGPNDGNYSDPTKWVGGVMPPNGFGHTVQLNVFSGNCTLNIDIDIARLESDDYGNPLPNPSTLTGVAGKIYTIGEIDFRECANAAAVVGNGTWNIDGDCYLVTEGGSHGVCYFSPGTGTLNLTGGS